MNAKPKRKSPQEQGIERLEQQATEGRPEEILRELLEEEDLGPAEPGLALGYLEKALNAAADVGTSRLIEIGFRESIRSSVGYLLRAEYLAGRCLKQWDGADANLDVLTSLNEQLLPLLERLQNHVVHLSKAYSSIRHILDLAERPRQRDVARVLKLVEQTRKMTEEAAGRVLPAQETHVA